MSKKLSQEQIAEIDSACEDWALRDAMNTAIAKYKTLAEAGKAPPGRAEWLKKKIKEILEND